MKKTLLLTYIISVALLTPSRESHAQSYPYWDVTAPGVSLDPAYWGGLFGFGGNLGNLYGNLENSPSAFVARNGAVYSVEGSYVVRWTPCDKGWEVLGVVSGGNDGGFAVSTLCINGNFLYIGGNFTSITYPGSSADASSGQSGVTIQCGDVAKMNLSTGIWSPVDDGGLSLVNFYNTQNGGWHVLRMVVDASGRIYVGSFPYDFAAGANVSASMLMSWDGSQWTKVGGGLIPQNIGGSSGGELGFGIITALAADGNHIYAGGFFAIGVNANGQYVNSPFFIEWDGTQWLYMDYEFPMNSSHYGINSIAVGNADVFIAGPLQPATTSPVADFARYTKDGILEDTFSLFGNNYDPTIISTLGGNGMGGEANALSILNGNVYIAGLFDRIDGLPILSISPGVVQWNNGVWNSLGTGLGLMSPLPPDPLENIYSGFCNAIAADINAVYVASIPFAFDLAGGQPVDPASYCVRWVTGPDQPSGSAVLTPGQLTGNTFTFTITGTPASCWQVQKLNTYGNWDPLGVVELVNGTVTFTDTSAVDASGQRIPYYRIANKCSASPPISLPTKIAVGGYHSLAVSNGAVCTWGLNLNGELGNGTSGGQNATPIKANGLSNMVAVAGGNYHSLALKSDGTVWAWGQNYYGQIGNLSGGNGFQVTSPVKLLYNWDLHQGPFVGIIGISAGWLSSYAVKSNGTVWAWGRNANGQLGNGTTLDINEPSKVLSISNAISVAGGNTHALALTTDGKVWAWGNNGYGQLGSATPAQSITPIVVGGLSNIIAIAAGGYSSYALQSGGKVWAWGYNGSGQLGDGTQLSRPTPQLVTGLNGAPNGGWPVMAISAGQNYALAVSPGFSGSVGGPVLTWGDNTYGQLGQGSGTFTPSSVPVIVANPDGTQSIEIAPGSAASGQALSLQTDSSMLSWGRNTSGQLGRGFGPNQDTLGHVSGF